MVIWDKRGRTRFVKKLKKAAVVAFSNNRALWNTRWSCDSLWKGGNKPWCFSTKVLWTDGIFPQFGRWDHIIFKSSSLLLQVQVSFSFGYGFYNNILRGCLQHSGTAFNGNRGLMTIPGIHRAQLPWWLAEGLTSSSTANVNLFTSYYVLLFICFLFSWLLPSLLPNTCSI